MGTPDHDIHLRFNACPKSVITMVSHLGQARQRREIKMFKAEGTKCVRDTIAYFSPAFLLATAEWINANAEIVENASLRGVEVLRCTRAQLERVTDFRTVPPVVAVYHLPEPLLPDGDFGRRLSVALDGIQDPGNMGSILRTCDWFGIHDIVCSCDTVDLYNPKVVQATMGAISRMRVSYLPDLAGFLCGLSQRGVEICGTFLNGDNLFAFEPTGNDSGVVVMGNEGKGVTPEVAAAVTRRLTIPAYPPGAFTSESLNVGAATAIVLSYLRNK